MPTVTVTEHNFAEEVCQSETPVLVDFWASWCAPCRKIAPVLEEISNELQGQMKIAKININDDPDLANKYRIQSIPTMLLFENGKVKDTFVGAMGKEQLISLLKQ